jgi:hypothetical protein
MKTQLFFTGLLLLPLVYAACGDDDDGSAQPSAGAPIPAEVRAIEEAAEDAIDQVFADNWTEVSADATSIEDDWQTFLSSAQADGVSDGQKSDMAAAISAMREASRLRDGLDARQGANNVSEVIIDVFDLFQVTIPTDVGRLDYLERQVIIDAEQDDWDAVGEDVVRVRETFDGVRGEVETAGGLEQTQAFDESIVKQEELAAARDRAITEEATVGLELVDALESVY